MVNILANRISLHSYSCKHNTHRNLCIYTFVHAYMHINTFFLPTCGSIIGAFFSYVCVHGAKNWTHYKAGGDSGEGVGREYIHKNIYFFKLSFGSQKYFAPSKFKACCDGGCKDVKVGYRTM